MSKKTLVIGASTNPSRYANIAVNRLRENNHEVVALGLRKGTIAGVEIDTYPEAYDGLDTVTMYLGAARQVPYYNYILSLRPKRVIFNPGAENQEFQEILVKHNIEVLEACTLVMLSTDQY